MRKIFMNLREADFSDRAQKGLTIKENIDELDSIKIFYLKILLTKRTLLENKLARQFTGSKYL